MKDNRYEWVKGERQATSEGRTERKEEKEGVGENRRLGAASKE
jgi:hypothetical protein